MKHGSVSGQFRGYVACHRNWYISLSRWARFSSSRLLKNRKGAQDFKIRGHFTKMAESIEAFPASLVDLQVEVELVFPRPAPDRAGFDFGQVDISQSENRKSFK